jgi:hypothetical protein
VKSPPRIGLATSLDQKIPRRSRIRFPLPSLRHNTFVAQCASYASSHIQRLIADRIKLPARVRTVKDAGINSSRIFHPSRTFKTLMMASVRTGEVFESNLGVAHEASTNLLVVSTNALVVSTNAFGVSTKEVGGQLAAGESITGPRILIQARTTLTAMRQ